MDWNRNAGGREELSPFEGPQAAPGSESRVAATSASVAQRPTHCQQKSGRIGFNRWRLLHQFQQAPGLSAAQNQTGQIAQELSALYTRMSKRENSIFDLPKLQPDQPNMGIGSPTGLSSSDQWG